MFDAWCLTLGAWYLAFDEFVVVCVNVLCRRQVWHQRAESRVGWATASVRRWQEGPQKAIAVRAASLEAYSYSESLLGGALLVSLIVTLTSERLCACVFCV